ncbi:hypothetical protein ADK52_38340 [Streptomyces sp. WM6372]|nr:hypothetical protein ADK52_38340 [Streptomyces sp. WM6372]
MAVLEGSDRLGERGEEAGFHQRAERGGAVFHPLVLRLAGGRLGVGLPLQVHGQPLDVAVQQYVDVEQRLAIEAVAVDCGQHPYAVDHQVGHEQRAGEGAVPLANRADAGGRGPRTCPIMA